MRSIVCILLLIFASCVHCKLTKTKHSIKKLHNSQHLRHPDLHDSTARNSYEHGHVRKHRLSHRNTHKAKNVHKTKSRNKIRKIHKKRDMFLIGDKRTQVQEAIPLYQNTTAFSDPELPQQDIFATYHKSVGDEVNNDDDKNHIDQTQENDKEGDIERKSNVSNPQQSSDEAEIASKLASILHDDPGDDENEMNSLFKEIDKDTSSGDHPSMVSSNQPNNLEDEMKEKSNVQSDSVVKTIIEGGSIHRVGEPKFIPIAPLESQDSQLDAISSSLENDPFKSDGMVESADMKEDIANVQLGQASNAVKIPATNELLDLFSDWVKNVVAKNPNMKLPQIKKLKSNFKGWLQKISSGSYESSTEPGLERTFDDFLRKLVSRNNVDHIVSENDDINEWLEHQNFSKDGSKNGSAAFEHWLHNVVHPNQNELQEWLHNSTLKYLNKVDKYLEKSNKDNGEKTNSKNSGNTSDVDLDHTDLMSFNEPYHVHYPSNDVFFDLHMPDNVNHHVDHHMHYNGGQVHHYYDHYYDNTSESMSIDHFVSSVHPCQNGGIIVPLGPESYQCICPKEYIGKKCEEINACCKYEPCQNNGTCNPIRNEPKYHCTCKKAYYGKHCEKKNPCEPNMCENGGTCTHNDKDETQCICKKGFRGEKCEEIDSCIPPPCRNGGTCSQVNAKNATFTCDCPVKFKGTICELPTFCPSQPCQNGGTCRETNDDFQCICREGFMGKTCTERPCLPSPCYNGATCVENGTNYECICAPWTSGKNCTEISPCRLKPCRSNGQCLDALSGFKWSFKPMQYYCLCRPPYMGPHCTDNLCNHCSPYGHCENSSKCVCDDGYYGNGFICQPEDANPCVPNPCFNDGACVIESSGDYHCHCKQPFKPPLCLTGDPCIPDPCKNGQCMANSDGTYRCKCEPGYRGFQCNITNPCSPNPCQHNGECNVDKDGNITCSCKGKWLPPICKDCGCPVSTEPQKVPSAFCNSEGKCQCSKNFNGEKWNYETENDRGESEPGCVKVQDTIIIPPKTACNVSGNPCFNGGTCQLINHDGNLATPPPAHTNGTEPTSPVPVVNENYKCLCTKWFYGPRCGIVKACIPNNPCLNGGTCQEDGKGNFTCKCPSGTGGWKCNALPTVPPKPDPHCTPNPCKNGGVCHALKHGYDCHCKPRYTGSHCGVDRCAECDENAKCVNGHCQCKLGYVGNGYDCVYDANPAPTCGNCPVFSTCTPATGYCGCNNGYEFVDRICVPIFNTGEDVDYHEVKTTPITTMKPSPSQATAARTMSRTNPRPHTLPASSTTSTTERPRGSTVSSSAKTTSHASKSSTPRHSNPTGGSGTTAIPVLSSTTTTTTKSSTIRTTTKASTIAKTTTTTSTTTSTSASTTTSTTPSTTESTTTPVKPNTDVNGEVPAGIPALPDSPDIPVGGPPSQKDNVDTDETSHRSFLLDELNNVSDDDDEKQLELAPPEPPVAYIKHRNGAKHLWKAISAMHSMKEQDNSQDEGTIETL